MIQLSEHWKKNLSEISCLPRNPSMLKKTDLLNCEICNGKIFLTAGIMNGSFVPCLPILIWSLGRATNRNSRLRKNRIYKFPVFMLSKKRYYIKKRRRNLRWKHINIGHLVHWQPWLEPFIPAIKTWKLLTNILLAALFSAWLWLSTPVIKWFLVNPEKRKILFLKNLRSNWKYRNVTYYLLDGLKQIPPSSNFYSCL